MFVGLSVGALVGAGVGALVGAGVGARVFACQSNYFVGLSTCFLLIMSMSRRIYVCMYVCIYIYIYIYIILSTCVYIYGMQEQLSEA